MTTLFWTLFAYCLLERLFELELSRWNQKRMRSRGFVEKEVPQNLRTMILVHAGWYVAMLIEAPLLPTNLPFSLRLFAAVVFIATQGLRFWVLSSLGERWNISVMSPVEDRTFVSRGPYRWIRHPNYLVVIIEIATLPLIGCAPLTALGFSIMNGLVLKRRIEIEEASLFTLPGYKETMGSKGRLLPLKPR